jgi:hypothetical protein
MLQDMDASVIITRPRSLVHLVLRDVHFWIPVIVLVGGLVVLHWIS